MLEKILQEITQLDPSKKCLKFLVNRIKRKDYRGWHFSQHNRYTKKEIKIIIQAIFDEIGEELLQIRTTDMSERPYNIEGEEAYARVVHNINKQIERTTQDSLRKNFFVDMHRMGLIERYNKYKKPTNPYMKRPIKYVSLTPLALEFLNATDLLKENFCYTQALENLLKGFGAECREIILELDSNYLDMEEMIFFVTFLDCVSFVALLNIRYFTRSEIIEYIKEYRSLSKFQKERLRELVQDYCNPKNFSGDKTHKRDYHNWKNETDQIFTLLEQSIFFERDKNRLILRTLDKENKQSDRKLKRSMKEKALYFEKHGVKKEKGFELHHIVPLCLARSIEEFDLLDKWENLIYIDAFNHAKISQTQNKHICLYFQNCDVILSKGSKEEQKYIYFTYLKNVLYKLDLQNIMLEYNKGLLYSKDN
ncbi:restriction endonuclease subunit R [Helicobacter cetorum]|uniref:restriction endonuclease subunit R n=1 Tax=Helicobacter cetorum TaxID=138563 RepID=UPI000CF1BC11|nr:restriction endonuclease subunit R [Helicobacter cetorum]